MKTAILTRMESTPEGTPGVLTFDDQVLHSLELPWKQNEHGKSCIPLGQYSLVWHLSPSKGWVYEVTNVPQRSDILIHSANFAGDTDLGFDCQLLGCIALGLSLGRLPNSHGRYQTAAMSSRVACQKFYDWGSREPILLTIRDD